MHHPDPAPSQDVIERQMMLARFAQEISLVAEEADLYRVAARLVRLILPFVDRCSIALLLPPSDTAPEPRLSVFALDGSFGSIPLGAELPAGGTILEEVIRKRGPGALRWRLVRAKRSGQQMLCWNVSRRSPGSARAVHVDGLAGAGVARNSQTNVAWPSWSSRGVRTKSSRARKTHARTASGAVESASSTFASTTLPVALASVKRTVTLPSLVGKLLSAAS
jgi:hypothetical protein